MESNKEQILELEKQKVKEILDFIRVNQLKIGTKEYEYFKQLISDLFDIDLSLHEQNLKGNKDVELTFINDDTTKPLVSFIDGYSLNNLSIVHKINLNELDNLFLNLNLDDIALRVFSCSEIIRFLFYAISHYRKINLAYSAQSNDKSLRFAKESILIDSIKKRNKRCKNQNISNRTSKFRKDNLDYLATYFFATLEVFDKKMEKIKEVSREEYVNYYIDALLNKFSDNPYYLKRYPILQKEYNMNGTKKSLSELIDNYFKELDDINNSSLNKNQKNVKIKNIKRMYFDIIIRRILPLRKEQEILDEETKLLSNDDRIVLLLDEIKSEQLRLKKINLGLLDKINIKKKIYNTKLNYISRNNKNVKLYINGIAYIYSVVEYIKLFNLELIYNNELLSDEEKEKSILFLKKYFFTRLPKNGYFILKDGTKVTIIEFYEKYIIPNIKELYNLDLNGYINFLRRLVISETDCDNIINQELVENYYLKKVSLINNFKKRLEDIRIKEI